MKSIFFKRASSNAQRTSADRFAHLASRTPVRDPIAYAAALEILG
jgi:hypothetical protein